MKERDPTVDILRGLGTWMVILIHIAPYFYQHRWLQWVYNWGQFAVPVLILCSVLVTKELVPLTPRTYLGYLRKRLVRLLLPYYFFLPPYLFLMWLYGKSITWRFIRENILLTGGINFNWLVLLYLGFMIVTPFLLSWHHHDRVKFWTATAVCAAISLLYLGDPSTYIPEGLISQSHRAMIHDIHLWHYRYRMSMLPTWTLIISASILVKSWWRDHPRRVWLMWMLSTVIFVWLYAFFVQREISVGLREHKYPPDLYFVAYSVSTMMICFWAISRSHRSLPRVLTRVCEYHSRQSYSLYFIHILVLYVLDVYFPTRPFSLVVFMILIYGVTYGIERAISITIARTKGDK